MILSPKETYQPLGTNLISCDLFVLKKAEFIVTKIETFGFTFVAHRTLTLRAHRILICWHEILYNNISN